MLCLLGQESYDYYLCIGTFAGKRIYRLTVFNQIINFKS